ncbi:MAG: hypothetical protein KF716_13050 [Anaerolineae bacterium]|nr:hypothetical protein [Anaerolineae bacterium]
MQTIALKARTDSDGVMKLEVTTDLVDQELEIILVMQPSGVKATDSMGYPLGYFEETYGSFADEPLERNQSM